MVLVVAAEDLAIAPCDNSDALQYSNWARTLDRLSIGHAHLGHWMESKAFQGDFDTLALCVDDGERKFVNKMERIERNHSNKHG